MFTAGIKFMKKTITLTHFSIDHGTYAARLSMFSIFFIFSFLFSAPLYSESNLSKFDSIDIDYRAAGIDKKVLLEQFEENPSAYRKKVERHKRERFIILTSAHEKAISKQFVDGMIKKNILLHDAKAKARVNKILVRLVKVMQKHYQTTSEKFYIVDTKGINACCLPDGTIILFRGLLEKLNDNELAWVMAHELSHGAAHHSAEMITEKLIKDHHLIVTES